MFRLLILARWLVISTMVSATSVAYGQTSSYPARPVTIITGIGVGGGPDVILRVLAERLSRLWAQQVVVLNRPGANNAIAMQVAAQAPADGYTLLMAPSGLYYVVPETQPNLTVSAARDFVPIGLVGEQPMLIAVNAKLGVTTLADLVALTKSKPGALTYGAGRGSLPHITAERLKQLVGFDLTLVPYPATAGAINDALTGTLPVMIESQSALAAALQSGTLRALAILSLERLTSQPDLPTAHEQYPALAQFESKGWFALVSPTGTPAFVIEKVSSSLEQALSDPALVQNYTALGTRARHLKPDQVRELIDRDQQLLRPIIRKLNLAR